MAPCEASSAMVSRATWVKCDWLVLPTHKVWSNAVKTCMPKASIPVCRSKAAPVRTASCTVVAGSLELSNTDMAATWSTSFWHRRSIEATLESSQPRNSCSRTAEPASIRVTNCSLRDNSLCGNSRRLAPPVPAEAAALILDNLLRSRERSFGKRPQPRNRLASKQRATVPLC